MRRLVTAALAAIALTGPALAQDAVIHAGYLLAKPGEGYLRKQTVTIKDGRIESVQSGYRPAEKGVSVINLRNAYVLPGLIDSHVHIEPRTGVDGRSPRGPGCRSPGRIEVVCQLELT